ncbi:MAG: LacI family DNA-binding transcriptional regulator [Actinomycetota bacterium]
MVNRQTNITIEDVAAAAEVSVATVSRALRGLPNVAEATRERVQRAAAQLEYRPDPNASRLATGRSGAVAVAVPVLNGWYFSQVVAGAEAVVKEAGHDLLVYGVGDEAGRARFLSGGTPLRSRVDGLVLVDLRVSADEAEALAASGVVAATVGFETPPFPSLVLDDRSVAATAVGYLAELGHRRIGLISGIPDDRQRFLVPERRRTGYFDALAAAGLEADPDLEQAGDFSIAGGALAMRALLKIENPPTAVFAMSDEMAFGAIQTAQSSGLSVPEDVSVVGVDDHDLAPAMRLTTVHQPVVENGAVAARLLLNQLSDRHLKPVRAAVDYELVVRASAAPPKSP